MNTKAHHINHFKHNRDMGWILKNVLDNELQSNNLIHFKHLDQIPLCGTLCFTWLLATQSKGQMTFVQDFCKWTGFIYSN